MRSTFSADATAPAEQGRTTYRATWNGALLAESEATVVVEGNHYFPPESLRIEHFRGSSTHTRCPWKGVASYYDIVVDGKLNTDAAWYYPEPTPEAHRIAGRVAFWRGVRVAPVGDGSESELTSDADSLWSRLRRLLVG